MSTVKQKRRSRDGCFTCRRRRKKCDSGDHPCGNCRRLGLSCDRAVKILWEDDARRRGTGKHGPQSVPVISRPASNMTAGANGTCESYWNENDAETTNAEDVGVQLFRSSLTDLTISSWPADLDSTEYVLLDHYIHRFSRTYPTYSGPENPFLQIFVPLAVHNRAVLDSLLALSGVQSWGEDSSASKHVLLKLRHNALRGCRSLLGAMESVREDTSPSIKARPVLGVPTEFARNASKHAGLIYVLASCAMLLLYEKLSDEVGDRCTPHLQFFSRLCSQRLLPTMEASAASDNNVSTSSTFKFLKSLFVYNDLVRATSLGAPIFSSGLFETFSAPGSTVEDTNALRAISGRSQYPRLISRISSVDLTVTDYEISHWSRRLDWIPSYALTTEEGMAWPAVISYDPVHVLDARFGDLNKNYNAVLWDDRLIICELYRIAAMMFRRQCRRSVALPQTGMGYLPSWGSQLIHHLPMESIYSNMLLWPIGIVAKELSVAHEQERRQIASKLTRLEAHFEMQHFGRTRLYLEHFWFSRDHKLEIDTKTIFFG